MLLNITNGRYANIKLMKDVQHMILDRRQMKIMEEHGT